MSGFLMTEIDCRDEKAKSQLERNPLNRARLRAEGDTGSLGTRDSITAGEKATVIFQDPVRCYPKKHPQTPCEQRPALCKCHIQRDLLSPDPKGTYHAILCLYPHSPPQPNLGADRNGELGAEEA